MLAEWVRARASECFSKGGGVKVLAIWQRQIEKSTTYELG
jgi:hypothetical protein